MHPLVRRASWVLGLAGLVACGSDSTGAPADTRPVGSYHATQFVTTGSSGVTNQLLNGATLDITLAATGTTSGHLHVPAQGTTTPALDADMAGSWQISGNNVTFTQAADTFVKDLTFTLQPVSASSWDLTAKKVINGTQIQLTLSR